ncbi:plexin-B1-like, partial [Plectropomus leopardus]|uniref:plexin-B1-like n=1 Tax=Plectropomus leopardus TaxID=160734 RepID=UPI001C4B861B
LFSFHQFHSIIFFFSSHDFILLSLCRYYADIRQTISASDQEMNSALAELSRNYAAEVNCLVALHELYKYINKYYDQIITALEEDSTAQKMQLGYRLQQIAAAVENKVTDL